MASLTKKPDSRYWIACFTDATGRQRQKSTKACDRMLAMKMAIKWEESYRKGITENQAHKALSDIREDLYGERLKHATATTFFTSWLKRKAIETTEGSLKRYEAAVSRFLKHLGERAHIGLAGITREDVSQWRDETAAKLSAGSVNVAMKILRAGFNEAKRAGYIPENPADGIVGLRKDTDRRRPFSPEEIKKLLDIANEEWRGAILAGLYTGQRLGDIATLRWSEANLVTREIAFTTQKTRRRVVLPMAAPLHRHLLTLPSADRPTKPVFPELSRIFEKNGTGDLSNAFHDLVMAPAGLVEPRSKKSQGIGRDGRRQISEISFHSLRHTLTSMLKNAGVNDAVARDIVGHESAAISRSYTHIEDAAKRTALDKLPDFTTKTPRTVKSLKTKPTVESREKSPATPPPVIRAPEQTFQAPNP